MSHKPFNPNPTYDNYKIVNARLPNVHIQALDEIANKANSSRNYILQYLVSEALQNPEKLEAAIRESPLGL